jgi:hypothetical protein
MQANPTRSASSRRTRALLGCGAVAGPLFVTVFVVEGRQRRDYNAMRQPVSALALGPRGVVQTANFVVAGTLFLAGARGLSGHSSGRDRLVPALIGGAGLGLLAAAVFPTDPVSGYPPGKETAEPSTTATGTLHNLAALPVFLGVPAAAAFSAVKAIRHADYAWGVYSAVSAATTLATNVLAGAGFGQSPRLVNVAGLCQRIAITAAFGWVSVVCVRARCGSSLEGRPQGRSPRSTPSAGRATSAVASD